MNALCETCKWWGVEQEKETWAWLPKKEQEKRKAEREARIAAITHPIVDPSMPLDYGDEEFPFEVRECGNPNLHIFERTTEENGFCVADGSNYYAVFATGPKFGCVRHEAWDAKESK